MSSLTSLRILGCEARLTFGGAGAFLEHAPIFLGGVRFCLSAGRATPQEVAKRVAVGVSGLDVLEARLASEMWLVGVAPTVADLALYPYTAAAGGAGVDLSRWPGVTRWTERVVALRGIVDDWVPYPDNARPGRGRSIYD
jgi:glutathione S-transferase